MANKTKLTPEELREAAAALNSEAAAEESTASSGDTSTTPPNETPAPAPEVKAPPPELDHATAKPLARGPYRHGITAQTVYFHQNGWAYTASGSPIAPLAAADTQPEADAQKRKAAPAAK